MGDREEPALFYLRLPMPRFATTAARSAATFSLAALMLRQSSDSGRSRDAASPFPLGRPPAAATSL